jgi:hypothetical protein
MTASSAGALGSCFDGRVGSGAVLGVFRVSAIVSAIVVVVVVVAVVVVVVVVVALSGGRQRARPAPLWETVAAPLWEHVAPVGIWHRLGRFVLMEAPLDEGLLLAHAGRERAHAPLGRLQLQLLLSDGRLVCRRTRVRDGEVRSRELEIAAQCLVPLGGGLGELSACERAPHFGHLLLSL